MRNIQKLILLNFESMRFPDSWDVDFSRPRLPRIRCKCCDAFSNSVMLIKHDRKCVVGKAMAEYEKLYAEKKAAKKQKAVASMEFECLPSFGNFGNFGEVMEKEQTLKITFPDGGSTTFHGRCSSFTPGVAKTKKGEMWPCLKI